MKKICHIRKSKLAIGLSSALAFSLAQAESPSASINLDIKSQPVGQSLLELGEAAGVQIILPQSEHAELSVAPLVGDYTLKGALSTLAGQSGLDYKFVSDKSVIISFSEADEEGGSEEASSDEADEEIVIIGSSLITDPGKLTRQTTSFTREEIERSGATRLDDFLRRLPQNLNAPNNVGSGFGADAGTGIQTPPFGLGANIFSGSSVNLRGLGAQNTLILIDGRRQPRGGQFGDITDISNIPLARVESIEILYDGAAAIYGADAAGGVININTRRDYEGIPRYHSPTLIPKMVAVLVLTLILAIPSAGALAL